MKSNYAQFVLVMIGVISLFSCESEKRLTSDQDHQVFYDKFKIKKPNCIREVAGTIDAMVGTVCLSDFVVELGFGCACGNFYEYDPKVVLKGDTSKLNFLKDQGYESFAIVDDYTDVDLDYYRRGNVFFDTLDGIPCKIIKPRIAGKGRSIYLFDSINPLPSLNTNECLCFKAEGLNSKQQKEFDDWMSSIKFLR